MRAENIYEHGGPTRHWGPIKVHPRYIVRTPTGGGKYFLFRRSAERHGRLLHRNVPGYRYRLYHQDRDGARTLLHEWA